MNSVIHLGMQNNGTCRCALMNTGNIWALRQIHVIIERQFMFLLNSATRHPVNSSVQQLSFRLHSMLICNGLFAFFSLSLQRNRCKCMFYFDYRFVASFQCRMLFAVKPIGNHPLTRCQCISMFQLGIVSIFNGTVRAFCIKPFCWLVRTFVRLMRNTVV